MKARVMRSTGSWYEVMNEEGSRLQARLRGVFRNKGLKVTNPIAVGDWVELSLESEHYVIKDILPRENYLIRKSTRKTAHGHILASNIDQAMLIVTLAFPRTSVGFIDRFLVTAESFRIPVHIIFNKSDDMDKEMKSDYEDLKSVYESLDYPLSSYIRKASGEH